MMKENRNKAIQEVMSLPVEQVVDKDNALINFLCDINHMMRKQFEGKASQQRILIILEESEEITQRDLTKRLGIKPGSASEILAKLEHAGLITRKTNKNDRRTVNILLTEYGRQLALEAKQRRKQRHKEMFSCLSEDEKTTLLALLKTIHTDWSKRYQHTKSCEHAPSHHRCHHDADDKE